MSESYQRVRKFTEIRSANYRSRPGTIETAHEWIGPDSVAHDLIEHDLEQLVAEHAALAAEVQQLRAEVADFPELLANAQEVGLERIEAAFGEGWDKCRKHLDDEAQIKRQIYVTEYSNTLPWPKWAAPQQPERDGAGS